MSGSNTREDSRSLAIIPGERKKSDGLTAVPTLTMRAMFLPYPDNYKYEGKDQIAYQSTSSMGNIRIKSRGLNVHTDFPIFAKAMQIISDRDLASGELVRIPFSDFTSKSVYIDLSNAGRSKQRLINSFDRLQSLTVAAFDGDIKDARNITKWVSFSAFNTLGFDSETNEVIIECNHHLRKWYADSFRQVLVEQFNQIEKNYSKALYLYLESINDTGVISVYVEYLRDFWFRSRFEGIADRNKRRASERNVERHILDGFDELNSLQYFETLHIDKFTTKEGKKKTKVTFKKNPRRVRNRISANNLDADGGLSDVELLMQGSIIKPTRSRLPKRPYKLDDTEHLEQLIEWALESFVILTEYNTKLLAFNGTGLLYKDKVQLKKVTDFLKSHNVKLKALDKPAPLSLAEQKKMRRLENQKQVLTDKLMQVQDDVIQKCRIVFDIDASQELPFESEEVQQVMALNKTAMTKLTDINAQLERVNNELGRFNEKA